MLPVDMRGFYQRRSQIATTFFLFHPALSDAAFALKKTDVPSVKKRAMPDAKTILTTPAFWMFMAVNKFLMTRHRMEDFDDSRCFCA